MFWALLYVIVAALPYFNALIKRTLQSRLKLLHGPTLSASFFYSPIINVLTIREYANYLLVDFSMTCPHNILVYFDSRTVKYLVAVWIGYCRAHSRRLLSCGQHLRCLES